jgi:hypothetical protein
MPWKGLELVRGLGQRRAEARCAMTLAVLAAVHWRQVGDVGAA